MLKSDDTSCWIRARARTGDLGLGLGRGLRLRLQCARRGETGLANGSGIASHIRMGTLAPPTFFFMPCTPSVTHSRGQAASAPQRPRLA